MRFSGTIPAKMDAKGRVFLPSAFRKQLGDAEAGLVLRRDAYQPCLTLYPAEAWEQEVERLRHRLNRWNPQEAMLFRQFLAAAEALGLDANGRFLVSKHLQQAAGLGRELLFIGVDDRIELWDKERAAATFLSDDAFGQALQSLAGAVPGSV